MIVLVVRAWAALALADPVPDGPFVEYDKFGVRIAEGYSIGGRFEGPFTRWHETGFIQEEGAYRHGLEDGLWHGYDEDGLLTFEGAWVRGRSHGTWRFFHDNGTVASEGSYVDGYKYGPWAEWLDDGTLLRVTWWEVDGAEQSPAEAWCRDFGLSWEVDLGRRVEGCRDEDDERIGTWRGYHENGAIAWERTYAAGLEDGEGFDFHPDGTLLHAGNYRIGAPDGVHVWQAPDGGVLGVDELVNGTGPWRAFHPNGEVAEDGAWLGFRRDGRWLTFDTRGHVKDDTTYARGQPLATRHWKPGLWLEGAFVEGARDGSWQAWSEDGMVAWRGAYETGMRVGLWHIGDAELELEDGEVVAFRRSACNGRLSQDRLSHEETEGEQTLAWPDGTFVAADDPDEIQAWLLANPAPGRARLLQTTVQEDRPPATLEAPEGTTAAPAEGVTNDDGEPVGHWIYFYEDGVKREEGDFENGRRVGAWYGWRPDGSLAWAGHYANDRLDGTWTTYRDPQAAGARPQILLSGRFDDGRRTGRWTWFHPNGSEAVAGDYLADRETGPWRGLDEAGRPVWEGAYVDGRRRGDWTFWRDGELVRTTRY